MNKLVIRDVTIGEGTPKLCVPIIGKTKEEIIEQAMQIREQTIDLVEFRADWFEDVFSKEKVLEVIAILREVLGEIPLLFTFRTSIEGGEKSITPKDYAKLLKAVANKKWIDLIDVEGLHDTNCMVPLIQYIKKKGIKVLLSNHNFEKTPAKHEMMLRLKFMEALGGDIIKLAVMPKNYEEVGSLLDATKEMVEQHITVPVVTMSMGEVGVCSRILGEQTGSCITFGCVDQTSAPGQLGVEKLKTAMDCIKSTVSKKEEKPLIYLIGFMGTGKSTIASYLEKEYSMEKIEIDEAIEQHEGESITQIFATKGEGYFRDLETRFLGSVQQKQNMVVSCGGGIVLRDENVRLMKNSGKLVLLSASPKEIYTRVSGNKNRPLLNENMSIEHIKELLVERVPSYEAAADIIIHTEGKSISQIGNEIIESLNC